MPPGIPIYAFRRSPSPPYQWTPALTNVSMHPVTEEGNKPSRRVLLVSYWYPPALGAAAERIHAFANYLPDHGWQTHVLTAERPGTPTTADETPC